ncbi:MAG: cellulase family glycosylhydrolase [Anaerolineae bacterium]|nr:cellulase family glycosylhydrolase [Anaerolineae bacterium]
MIKIKIVIRLLFLLVLTLGCVFYAPTISPTVDIPTAVVVKEAQEEIFLPHVELLPASPLPTALSPVATSTAPTPTATAAPTEAKVATPESPPTATPIPPPVLKPDYGIQIDPNDQDLARVLRWVEGLGFRWVKVQVEWSFAEARANEYRWEDLDRVVALVNEFQFDLLIGVVDAPGWLRAGVGYNGPPTDPAEFGRFMTAFATHYAGQVTAYELWNEPNLSREWYGETLNPAAFVTLVAQGSQAIRQADPQALIISGGLGVTGIDDGIQAIDDRRFLREALNAGLAQWVDGIGVHPYGYANPPWERASDTTHTASAWNEHPSFFFLDTLEDYHAILQAAGVTLSLWPTEFGWPSVQGIRSENLPSDFAYPYAAWVTEEMQAQYLVEACRLMDERPWVGPFFVWNLNTVVVWGAERPEAVFSLLRPDTAWRPAYIALRVHEP